MDVSDAEILLSEAGAALDSEDPPAALVKLRETFRQPELHKDPALFAGALKMFSRISERLASPEFAGMVEEAAAQDPQALYNLGGVLLSEHLADIALTVFRRLDDLIPGEEAIIGGVVQALENEGRNKEACETLRGAAELLETSFFLRYLLVFNGIMTGDLENARGSMDALGEPFDREEAAMAARVGAMLARAATVKDICALDGKDLRGWHYVLTGGILTHLSPYGFDDGMNGRYAFTQDSHERCKEGLLRLKAVLDAWRHAPERIISAGDRGSTILATAAAELFGLPLESYGDPERKGLIVAYDPIEFPIEAYELLAEHKPGQILYCHAARWTEPTPYAPDIVTLLYQTQQTPWGERMRVNAETRETETLPPDARTADEIAADILAGAPEDGAMDDIADLGRIAAVMKDNATAFEATGQRAPIWYQGPVKSSRFL